MVQAVLEFYGVRAKAAGRNMVIQRVGNDLKMSSAEMSLIIKAHTPRNETAYHSLSLLKDARRWVNDQPRWPACAATPD